MLLKPKACEPCPAYANGLGFCPDEIVPGASVSIVLQGPGKHEEAKGIPAIGDTGEVLNKHYLPKAGLERGKVNVMNIIKCRWTVDGRKTDLLPTGDTLRTMVNHCTQAYLRVPRETKLIIAQGSLAFNYFSRGKIKDQDGDPATVTQWRGYLLPEQYQGVPVYSTVHIADIFRDPKQAWIAEQDWRKVPSILSGEWPQPLPEWLGYPYRTSDIGMVHAWMDVASKRAKEIIIDTEYRGPILDMIGMGYLDESGPTILQIEWQDGIPKGDIAHHLRNLVSHKPVVFQNFAADMPILRGSLGISYQRYFKVHDTMLAHSRLWCELPHTLEFLGSIYSPYNKNKHLALVDPYRYNVGDVVDTIWAWEALKKGLQVDSGARYIYEKLTLPLIPTLLESKEFGLATNRERLHAAIPEYRQIIRQSLDLGMVATGWPINLGSSDQMQHYLYQERRYDIQIKRKTKQPTADQDAIAKLRVLVGPAPDEKKELTLDLEDAKHESALARVALGADPILEARVLYADAQHTLDNYAYGLLRTVYEATTKNAAKRARDKAKALVLQGVLPDSDAFVDRIYPDEHIHVQKSGRHSIIHPPLAQLPALLRDIVWPDEGYAWLEFDWRSVEPRWLEALCGSKILKRSFDENLDLHVWTLCQMFQYREPPVLIDGEVHSAPENESWFQEYNWTGKDDSRRRFAKEGRYEMWYGGTGAEAAQSAARYGLDPKTLKMALQRLLTSDPEYYVWRKGVEDTAKTKRIIRTYAGRPRRLLGVGRSIEREALNHPMQGGVSDLFDETIILIKEAYRLLVTWMTGMHDSQKWQVAIPALTPALLLGIRDIVERPFTIYGRKRNFPADFKVTCRPGDRALVSSAVWETLAYINKVPVAV